MNTKINRAETCARSGLKASILNRETNRKLGKIEFDFEINCSPNSRIVLEHPNPPIGSGWNSPNFELPPGAQDFSGVASRGNVAQVMDGSKFMDTMSSRGNVNPSLEGTQYLSGVVSKANGIQILDGSKAWMDTMSSRENLGDSVRSKRNEGRIVEGTPEAGSKRKNFMIDDETVTPKPNEKSIDEITGEVKTHKRRATYAGVSSIYSDEDFKNIVHRYKLSLKDEIHYDINE